MTDDLYVYPSGATSSNDVVNVRCDLIPVEVLLKLGRTFAEGAAKHGERNWEKGLPEHACITRAMIHLSLYAAGDTSEDHLGHALCRCAMLATFAARRAKE